MLRIFGLAFPSHGTRRPTDAGRRRSRVRRPGVEPLEGRPLMTTVIPYRGGPASTTALVTRPDLYLLTGTLPTSGTLRAQTFVVTVNLIRNVPTTIGIALDRGVSPTIDASLFLNTGTSDSTVSNYHQRFNTAADDSPTSIQFIPKAGHTGYQFTISLVADNQAAFPATGDLPYTVDVTVNGSVVAPHLSIVSFAKDSASAPLYSNGGYELTYQVSGAGLPDNPNLKLAVYWATGSTANSIITGAAPVATGRLERAVGTHLFPIRIAQLVNPPVGARSLIAILDNYRVLPASQKSGSVFPLSTSGAPTGQTWLDAPLSAELHNSLLASAPPAPTREQRVRLWLRGYSGFILKAASDFLVDPVAIAGAVAWEALQNVKTNLLYPLGPGKVHPFESGKLAAAQVVEGKAKYQPKLPVQNVATRTALLATPGGAIRYIAAIMNAYAYESEHAPNGRNIRNRPGILATYYNGAGGFELENAAAGFKLRYQNPSPLLDGPTMGRWVEYNADYLRAALGIS